MQIGSFRVPQPWGLAAPGSGSDSLKRKHVRAQSYFSGALAVFCPSSGLVLEAREAAAAHIPAPLGRPRPAHPKSGIWRLDGEWGWGGRRGREKGQVRWCAGQSSQLFLAYILHGAGVLGLGKRHPECEASSRSGGDPHLPRIAKTQKLHRAAVLFFSGLRKARRFLSSLNEAAGFFFFSREVAFGCNCMKSQWCRPVAMDLGVYQLRHFSISFLSSLLGTENASVRLDNR